MRKHIKRSVWSLIVLALFSAGLKAQTKFVYTNNDTSILSGFFAESGPNSISAYSMDNDSLCASAGDLAPCQIANSPFLTGGTGTSSGPLPPSAANRIIVVGSFLYASNSGSSSISAFQINPTTGQLTQVGSPVATADADPSPLGISLAATPLGQDAYLYAGTGDGNITIYSINTSTGALTPFTSNSPEPSDGSIASMKVTPQKVKVGTNDEYLLAVALYQANAVDMFEIKSNGSLVKFSGSPFSTTLPATEGGYTAGIDINCSSDQLFAGRSGVPEIDVFNINIDSQGTLTLLGQVGFSSSSSTTSYPVVVLSHPNDGTPEKTLFASDPGDKNVTAFTVSAGSLAFLDSAGVAGTSGETVYTGPGGLAVGKDGASLYLADTSVTGAVGAISTFGFNLSDTPPFSFSSLTYPVPNPFATDQVSRLQSLVAYPANACPAPPAPSSSLTASLQVSDGPPPAFDLEATLTVDSSVAVDPVTQPVTIQIGNFTLILPPGSFKTFQEGRNAETYLFEGVIESTTLKVQVTSLGDNQFEIHALDKQVDLPGLDSPVTVTVGIGGNSASTDVTASFDNSLRGNWRNP